MKKLELLNIYLSWYCNLCCKHCWVSATSSKEAQLEKLDINLVKEAIKDAVSLGVKIIKISGGEPFLYLEELYETIKICKYYDLEVNIETNGTIINKEIVKLLNKKKTFINISLDGYNSDTHNAIRGNNLAYQQTMKGIDILQKNHICFGITHSISDNNFNEIDKLIEFLSSKSIKYLKLNPIIAIGRAAREKADYPYLLSMDKMIYIFENYDSKIIKGVSVGTMVPPCFVKPYKILMGKSKLCGCNYTSMISILPDGTVGLCGEAKDMNEFIFGNLKKNSLENIWFCNNKLKKVQNTLYNIKGVCSTCKYLNKCLGGCRIVAYLHRSDVNASNPLAEIFYLRKQQLPYDVIKNSGIDINT